LSHIYSIGTPFERAAIEDIDLEIEKGDFVGLIGHTGSGKSTLIQHFNGLLKPAKGKIYVDGQDIWSSSQTVYQARFKVGLVFQYPEYQLFEETVYKDISFGPKNMGLPEEEIHRRVVDAAAFAGLSSELLDTSPFELSGGEKRRAAIAGVMAMEPDVLVLDEPTAGLDPKGRDDILGRIREYHQSRGSTIILVSHSMEDVAKNADKVLVMNKGRIAMYGGVREIFARASELAAIGLSVPQITKVFIGLSQKGYDVDPTVFTVKEASEQLLKLLKKGEAL
jgi:energy-coupling factor transport system ATP-binding protein